MTVVYICGTAGTGKTTISTYLKKYGFFVINLSHLVKHNKLYLGYDAERDSLIIDEEKLNEHVKNLVKKKKQEKIVIEGIGAEALPDELADLCVVLTCSIKTLKERLKSKGYSERKIMENLEAEKFGIILGDAESKFFNKVLTLDTSKLTPEQAAEKIVEKLRELKKL